MKRLLFASLLCSLFAGSVFAAEPAPAPAAPPARPKLVDLGASVCIPCRMMAPILDELAREYAGQFDVEFVDVWKTRGAGERYGIRLIPTQIFYDAAGRELFRHEGFYAKKDILAKWKELGLELRDPSVPLPAQTPFEGKPSARAAYLEYYAMGYSSATAYYAAPGCLCTAEGDPERYEASMKGFFAGREAGLAAAAHRPRERSEPIAITAGSASANPPSAQR